MTIKSLLPKTILASALCGTLLVLGSGCLPLPASDAEQTMHAIDAKAGLHAGLTMTAFLAQQLLNEAAATFAAETVTMEARRTQGAQTAAAVHRTNVAATPTAAALQTSGAATLSVGQTAQAIMVAGTHGAATLTQEANVAAVQGTSTAIAVAAVFDQQTQEAPATWAAATSTQGAKDDLATQTQAAKNDEEVAYNRARNDVMAWGGAIALVLLGVGGVVTALMFALAGLQRFASSPQVIRRDAGEPAPLFVTSERRAVVVHDPARQPAATATTAQPGLPAGVPPLLQAEVTRLAQQGEMMHALALFTAAQRAAKGERVKAADLPPGVTVKMLEAMVGTAGVPAEPQVMIVRIIAPGQIGRYAAWLRDVRAQLPAGEVIDGEFE